ncbi:MAG TPA: hypothetical protein VKY56_04430 [Chloroflexota bacterium]|jgi:hypothetical protein|nr:hypothetical protein [Chloroflexota bacterium]
MFESLKQLLRRDSPDLVAEGRIVEMTGPAGNGKDGGQIEFKLDSRADLIFRHRVSALSPVHKRGDAVRVHYEPARDDPHVALVHWIEAWKG